MFTCSMYTKFMTIANKAITRIIVLYKYMLANLQDASGDSIRSFKVNKRFTKLVSKLPIIGIKPVNNSQKKKVSFLLKTHISGVLSCVGKKSEMPSPRENNFKSSNYQYLSLQS